MSDNNLKKILYVEDDSSIAQVAIMAMEDLGGFEVNYCVSGVAALKELEHYEPQLILMDVMMPEMDGPETMQHIHAMPKFKDIPIIFMTARVQKHEVEEYFSLGAVDVVVKPFDPMTLSDQLIACWEKCGSS